MRKFKSEYESRKISTPDDALYYGGGIPSIAWGKPKLNIQFLPIMGGEGDGEVKVGVQTQEEWFPTIMAGDMLTEPYLIFLSSVGSDALALRATYELMKVALHKDMRVQITNAARIDKEDSEDGETVFMLHNVFEDANKYRMQSIRDWITIHEDCFRIVVIAGMCPYAFSKQVRVEPHAMFKVDVAKTKMKINRA
jgi:hypothetical protein